MAYDERQAALEMARLLGEVRRLQAENERLLTENRQLREKLDRFEKQVAELERITARQAAPFRREEPQKVAAAEKKRPGRKPGHRGFCRALPEHVDQEIEAPLACCPHCRGAVTDRTPLVQWIEELPPLRPVVTRLTTWEANCPRCGAVRSTHPLQTSTAGGAARVQLGPRALAVAALLNKELGVTMRKTCRVLAKLWGMRLTPGGLSQALDRVADKTATRYNGLLETIRASGVVYADETSWWVGGPGWWLWTFTQPTATLYRVEKSRGSEVAQSTLGNDFPGMLVSDCLNVYDALTCRKHKCIAHHQRAIANARDRPDTKDGSYLQQWKWLFQAVTALWKARPMMAETAFALERARIETWCQRLLDEAVTQPGDVAVQNRLLKQWPHLLGCLDEPAAEPTNNRAERSLRPAVIARKLSCGNRTERGKRTWEILASLAATCQQNADDFVDWLTPQLSLATASNAG
jgi:transposase